jgi:hypothetical protein
MEASKDDQGRHRDVEEDAFQKKVAAYLSARPVDPEDKSFKAYRTRFRCVQSLRWLVVLSLVSWCGVLMQLGQYVQGLPHPLQVSV